MPHTAELSRKFYDRVGDDVANELVDWFNAVDETYRMQLRELNDLNWGRFQAGMDARFAEFELRMEKRFAEVDAKMERGFAAVEVKMERRFADQRGWAVGLWIATIVPLGGLMVGLFIATR